VIREGLGRPKPPILGVKNGVVSEDVRRIFGGRYKSLASLSDKGKPHPCWIYRAEEQGTSIDYIYFCFDHQRRVDRIIFGGYLGGVQSASGRLLIHRTGSPTR